MKFKEYLKEQETFEGLPLESLKLLLKKYNPDDQEYKIIKNLISKKSEQSSQVSSKVAGNQDLSSPDTMSNEI